MRDYSGQVEKIRTVLEEADAVIIGAGAGMSASAGFSYSGERFQKYFYDYEQKYGFHDMYSGGFYPFKSLEEFWAYWSRYIYINRYMDAPKAGITRRSGMPNFSADMTGCGFCIWNWASARTRL